MIIRRAFIGILAAAVLAGCAHAPSAQEFPPIVFVHGNGDTAALWQTTIWRFESNGWPRERLYAINVPYPLARDDDTQRSCASCSFRWKASSVGKRCSIEVIQYEKCCARQTRRRHVSE